MVEETRTPAGPTTDTPASGASGHSVLMDDDGRIRLPRGAANMAALLRIGLGLLYLWAFLSQGLGITYSNSTTDPDTGKVEYGWHFSHDADAGWISSGFTHSPTAPYVDKTHGPAGWLVQNLPTGLDDFGWIFAIGGLGSP
jgi:thiosulfate dehydrogenase (quinone) large subunit